MCKDCNQDNCCCKQYRGPKGDPGERGPRGLAGATGPSGPTNWWFSQNYNNGGTAEAITKTVTSRTSIGRILWPGSTATGGHVPTEIKVNAWMPAANGNGVVEIYDLTNGAVVATTGNITASADTTITTMTITPANITATPAVWQVRVEGSLVPGPGGAEISTASIEIRTT